MKRPIKAIIVDDEPLGRERIRMLLEEFPSVHVQAECGGGIAAVAAVLDHRPDVMFLDIQMSDLDGFGVVARLRREMTALPVIVFVTAYSEHAVKAFEVHAIDYLLKPVQAVRLSAAITRVESLLSKPAAGEDWKQRLFQALRETDKTAFWNRIEIRSVGKTELVPTEDVLWLKADGNYIEVHTAEKVHPARVTMGELEKHLDPQCFVRVCRSSLVNLNYVAGFQSTSSRGHVVVLKDGNKLPATRCVAELQSIFKYLPT